MHTSSSGGGGLGAGGSMEVMDSVDAYVEWRAGVRGRVGLVSWQLEAGGWGLGVVQRGAARCCCGSSSDCGETIVQWEQTPQ